MKADKLKELQDRSKQRRRPSIDNYSERIAAISPHIKKEVKKQMDIQDAKEKLDKIAKNYCMMLSTKDAPENESFEEKAARIKAVADRVNKALLSNQ